MWARQIALREQERKENFEKARALRWNTDPDEDKKFGTRKPGVKARYESQYHFGVYAPNFIRELAAAWRMALGARHRTAPARRCP